MDKDKLRAALGRAKTAHGKLADALTEIEALLNEEATDGQLAKSLVTTFIAKWHKRYGRAYVIESWPQALASFKRLIKSIPVKDLQTAVAAYLVSNEPFYVEAKHPLPMFVKVVNKFLPLDEDAADEAFLRAPVIDCRHTPRCRSDQEHTRKRSQELRA